MKVGIIGLGAMGSRISQNIYVDGHEVYVYNRTRQKSIDSGLKICDSPKTLVENSDVILSFVSNDEASETIWNHPETGGAQSITEKKIILECSTLSEKQSKRLSEQFKEQQFLLAPIVGSRPQAVARELVFLIGGNRKSYQAIKPIIESLSVKHLYFKNSIQACHLKLTINSLFGIQAIAFAEFYHGLINSGLSEEKINSLLPSLPITAPIMQMMLGLFAEKKFDPLFPIKLVEKDFKYACQFLQDNNVNSRITTTAHQTFLSAIQHGLGEQNISGIYNLFLKGELNE